MQRIISLFFLLTVSIQTSWGWGQIGHRAVGQLAQWHLNPLAAARIARVLGPLDLAMSSTWMDEVRSDSTYDHMYTWHWVTIPEGQTFNPEIQEQGGNAYETIQYIISSLKADTLGLEQEQEYLKVLVHLVGDVHQPLHVGTGEDRGGNDVTVLWMGDSSNLHRVWDSDMIDSKQLSYTELAAHLHRRVTPELITQVQTASPEQWLTEAMKLRPGVYDLPDHGGIGYRYLYLNFPVVEEQLLKAGLRLAGILNEIYG